MPAGGVGQYGNGPGTVTADCGSSQFLGSGRFWFPFGLSRIIWFTTARCRFMATRIWVKKSAVMVTSTSVLSEGSHGCCGVLMLCILMIGGMPWRIFISIGKAIETCAPASRVFFHASSDMPVMWMNRLSGPIPMWPLPPVGGVAVSLYEIKPVPQRGGAISLVLTGSVA